MTPTPLIIDCDPGVDDAVALLLAFAAPEALDLLAISQSGPVLHLQLNRPAKRNAISDGLIQQIHTAFVNLPESVKAVPRVGGGLDPNIERIVSLKPASEKMVQSDAAALLAPLVLSAQTAPRPPAPPPDETIVLSAFEVRSAKDSGYRVQNSVATTGAAAAAPQARIDGALVAPMVALPMSTVLPSSTSVPAGTCNAMLGALKL